ncbi:MAG: sulfite exporter TauE/SafE family protein [Clostridia bacterium]|nr:sulfite exporter TauE/SafE family protein [Clostridia bacterium]
MSDFLLLTLAGFLSGAAGAMGLGGGGFLMIYLTLFASVPQNDARGINLLFFLPCAALSVFLHKKNGLADPQKTKKLLPWGLAGAFCGTLVSYLISTQMLGKIFAVFLIFLGIKTISGPIKAFIDRRKKSNLPQ